MQDASSDIRIVNPGDDHAPGPVEIAPGVFWVGDNNQFNSIHLNPYLVVDNDEAVLIDPGSVLDFEQVKKNVESIIPLSQVKHIILQHQDPDLCSSTPLFEKAGFNGTVVTHWRTSVLVKYYGIQSPFHYTNTGEKKIVFGSNRVLTFYDTPYLHFPGAIVTWDQKTKILFTSDLFGAFTENWSLYAGDDYLEQMLAFHETYMPGKEILNPVISMLQKLPVSIIAPQHGSIINNEPEKYMDALRGIDSGLFMTQVLQSVNTEESYTLLLNRVLKRLAALYDKVKVVKAAIDADLPVDIHEAVIDEDEQIDFQSCNRFFEIIFQKNGHGWISTVESLVFKTVTQLNQRIPDIYSSPLMDEIQNTSRLIEDNTKLQSQYNELKKQLRNAEKKLATDPLTELYQESYFLEYLKSEIETYRLTGIDCSFFIIDIDGIVQINKKYGSREGDETLNHATYLLRKFKTEDRERAHHLLFKLSGPRFAYYVSGISKEELTNTAEEIRLTFQKAEIFIEPVTVTIGVVHSSEMESEDTGLTDEYLLEKMIETARYRVRIGRSRGENTVIDQSTDEEASIDKELVLIADSDFSGASYLAEILREKGLQVELAQDGSQVLEKVKIKSPSVIVTEVMLPKIDGFSLRNEILKDSDLKDIPFVFISYLKDDDAIQRAISLGIEHYYLKPYNLVEVTGIIKLLAHQSDNDQY